MPEPRVRAEAEFEGTLHGNRLHVHEGMGVVTERRESVGRVSAVLVDEGSGKPEFVVLQMNEGERRVLLPVIVFDREVEGDLVGRFRREDVAGLPDYVADRNPTQMEVRRAYDAVGLDFETM